MIFDTHAFTGTTIGLLDNLHNRAAVLNFDEILKHQLA